MSYSAIKQTDWIAYTPQSNLTNLVSITGQYKRHGNTMELVARLQITSSTTMSGGVWISIPNGFTIGSSYNPGLGGDFLSDAMFQDVTAGRYRGSGLIFISWETPQKVVLQSIGANGVATAIGTNNPFTWGNNDIINLHVKYLPIAEWGG